MALKNTKFVTPPPKIPAMIKTSSPYLKELYKGAIKWRAFDVKTLKLAKTEDKIIFIHIGYIGNIEAREAAYQLFKDKDVIEVINNNFIPVAIDLEDVPEAMLVGMDLLVITEQYYNIPINIFSLPGTKPFTSFSNITPAEFLALSFNIIDSFREKRELLDKAGRYVSNRLGGTGIVQKREKPCAITDKLLHAYVKSWISRYIISNRRNRQTPYTINSRYYIFLLKYSHHYKIEENLKWLEDALDKVCFSAMYDPIDGGFFSQARNTKFTEPLYEKQLSENIQAAVLLSFGYKYFKHKHYKELAEKTIECIERSFKSPNGGGYMTCITLKESFQKSTYYKYSIDELQKSFPDTYIYIASALGMDIEANRHEQQIISNTHNANKLTENEISKLRSIRNGKSSEVIVDKRVITAYNCLYSTSLCLIANNLQNNGNEYTNRAQEIVANIIEHQKKDKIRLHRYISKEKNEHANADLLDYTFFLNALLHIYKYTNDEKYDNLISKYTAYIMLNFYQAHNGMFCKTSKTEIITPFKRESIIDYIRYSANSVMARNLLILYKTRKDEFFLSAFKQQLYNIAPQLIGTGPLMVGWALQILNYLSDRSDFD